MSEANLAVLAQPQSSPPPPPPFKLRLNHPHLLIQRMMAPPPKPDAYGYARRDDWVGVDVRVSKPQKRLALIIMDRLFKAIEQKGWEIEVGSNNNSRGTFAVDRHDRAPFWISEKHRQVEHVPTPKELKEKEAWPTTRIPKWDEVPTGELVLNPGGPVDVSSEHAVNTLITKAMADLEAQIARAKQSREAEQERRNEEFRREQAKQQEKARVEGFYSAAKALRDYRLAMEYIEEVRRFGRVPDGQGREGQSLDQWLEWAERQARCLHPLG